MWPGDVTFPDFTNNETYDYWSELVKKFHDEVKFDGMWIVGFLVKYYHIFICLNSICILQYMHSSGIDIDILQCHTFI